MEGGSCGQGMDTVTTEEAASEEGEEVADMAIPMAITGDTFAAKDFD